ncbi:hypothetical protein SANTM175S_02833 [Streptomyces antimycoticus]
MFAHPSPPGHRRHGRDVTTAAAGSPPPSSPGRDAVGGRAPGARPPTRPRRAGRYFSRFCLTSGVNWSGVIGGFWPTSSFFPFSLKVGVASTSLVSLNDLDMASAHRS